MADRLEWITMRIVVDKAATKETPKQENPPPKDENKAKPATKTSAEENKEELAPQKPEKLTEEEECAMGSSLIPAKEQPVPLKGQDAKDNQPDNNSTYLDVPSDLGVPTDSQFN